MPQIHASALVDSHAQLADDVVVGPYCIIEGAVTLGPGCRLMSHVRLHGPMTLGAGNIIYPFATLGFDPQDRKFDVTQHDPAQPGVVIGNENLFREGATVHRATRNHPTTIGHHNFFMVNSHVAHDCVVGNQVTLVNGALIGGHVTVADQAILSGNSTVHQFCRVGRLSMIGGSAGITQDLPPFCIVHESRTVNSLNLIGLRRAGLRQHIKPLGEAFDILYHQGLPNVQAAQTILAKLKDDPLCRELAEFVQVTRRGICSWTEKHAPEGYSDHSM